MPGTYRVELAKTGRAGCQNTECKKAGEKIAKDELRFGTWVTIADNESWRWKHWGCTTPVQLTTWWDTAEEDPALIDGLDELPDDLSEKVLRALHQGHVDDGDWKGDVEKNRPGQKGYRTPQKKKAAKETLPGSDDDQSPTKKPATKKRGRPKKEVADDTEEAAPAEQTKSRAKKVKAEEEDAETEKLAPAKKVRGRGAKKVKVEDDESDSSEAAPPVKKRKTTKKSAVTAVGDDAGASSNVGQPRSKRVAGNEGEEIEPAKPARKARGKTKNEATTHGDDYEEQATKPAKGRKKKATP